MKRKRTGIIVVIVFIVGALMGMRYLYGFLTSTERASVTFATPAPTPTPTPDPLAPKNVLILGYGGGNHEGGLLTDTMMVVHVDPRAHQVVLISIPRDLWVPLPLLPEGTVQEKINVAYAYGFEKNKYPDRPSQYKGDNGGGNLAKYAATFVTGLPIDTYVAVSFDGFKNALTTLGPIAVNVPYAFEDQFYPIDGKEKETCGKTPEEEAVISATESGDLLEREYKCRYETVSFMRGSQTMDAETALKFVRSRHSATNPGDFYRSMRQQALIQGVIAKLKTIGGLVKIPALIPQISKFVETDVTASEVLDLMQRYSDPLSFQIKRISLTTENVLAESKSSDGQYILVPKTGNEFDSVKQYINDQILQFKTPLSATPSAQ